MLRWSAYAFVLALAATTSLAGAASAAEVVYPAASRIGLVPPPGLAASSRFQGFADPDRGASILMVELAGPAFAELEQGMTAEALKTQGITVISREPLAIKDGRAFVLKGHQEVPGLRVEKWIAVVGFPDLTAMLTIQLPEAAKEAYPDAQLQAALESLTPRAEVPLTEQLEVLPFAIEDLSGFRIVRVLAGSSALLTDGPNSTVDPLEQPLIVIATAIGQPPPPDQRDTFARRTLAATPGMKELRAVRSEPLRMGGQQGHEIVAEAKDPRTEADLMAVQWLRFGAGGYLRIVAVARKDSWATLFPRLRTLRDGIDPR